MKMRDDGVQADRAVCVIVRLSEGANALEENGISLRGLFTMSDLESP